MTTGLRVVLDRALIVFFVFFCKLLSCVSMFIRRFHHRHHYRDHQLFAPPFSAFSLYLRHHPASFFLIRRAQQSKVADCI